MHGLRPIQILNPTLWVKKRRTDSASMICAATYRNGLTIIMRAIIIRPVLRLILRDLQEVNTVLPAAAPFLMVPGGSAHQYDTDLLRMTRGGNSDSDLQRHWNKGLYH